MAMTHEQPMYPSKSNGAGMTHRQEFDATETSVATETAAGAAAAQAQAAVQARYIIAMRRPRDWDQVRVRLLKDCSRIRFAEVARYRIPRGGKHIEGPSIRFAEAALRALTNVYPEITTIYDDDQKRIIRVAVTDLEANLTYSKDVVVQKLVERSRADGRQLVSQRINSSGQTTYIVIATDDELLAKENALVSKAMRQHALRIMPGDLVEEALDKVYETIRKGVAEDPDAHRKKLVDAFVQLHVQPAQLAEFLGHELATASPAEIVELREIYSAIRDGETSWHDIMEGREKPAKDEPKAEASSNEPPKTTADLAKRTKKKQADASEPPPPNEADMPREPGAEG